MKADSVIVEEVRRRREELCARFGEDLDQIIAHLWRIEQKHDERVVNQRRVVRRPRDRDKADSSSSS